MDGRLTRRVMGLLKARLPEIGLHHVADCRRQASILWPMGVVLEATVVAMVAGCKSLAHLEALTEDMSATARRCLKLKRRIPDTTARQILVGVEPDELRDAMRRQVKAAHRRKALKPVGLPFGVVSMDGKFVTVPPTWKSRYVQVRNRGEPHEYGLIGTITATLISSESKVCLDAEPIHRAWGEESRFPYLLDDLLAAYGGLDLFRLVVYDAGACSRSNARETREQGLHYLFRVKAGKQPKLFAAAEQQMGDRPLELAEAIAEERYRGKRVRRSVYSTENAVIWPHWTGQRAVIRIRCDTLEDDGQVLASEDRYYVTNLASDGLTPDQWITVTRGHWAVENNCHHTWDAAMEEDDRRWIVSDPQGSLAVMLLRRIAYNILTLFRGVTLRSRYRRLTPWRVLFRWVYNALLTVRTKHMEGLRPRKKPIPTVA